MRRDTHFIHAAAFDGEPEYATNCHQIHAVGEDIYL
jgi:hypothetical protein